MAERLSINDFIQAFKEGFVHPNLFRVTFAGPNFVNDRVSIACKSAIIPGVTYTEGKFSVDGKYRKFVAGADLDPAEFVFYVDKDGKVMKTFDDWGTAIFNMENGEFGFKDEYECTITVEILDRAGETIYKADILKAYPTVITSFDLNYREENRIMEYSITFNYERVSGGTT